MLLKDFYIPFDFKNRRPIFINRLLFIPNHYFKHKDFKEKITFDNDKEIQVEYCSGNGEWILNKANENPDINFIAVEIKFERARKIWVNMHNQKINNLFIVLGEALIFTKYYIDENFIGDVYINFPDPWPKKKHAKNRLISTEFLVELSRVMRTNKTITIVTDHKTYLKQIIEIFLQNKNFQPIYKKPYYIQDLKDFGSSFFKSLFLQKDIKINYLTFIRL